jgi:hypothetical protein
MVVVEELLTRLFKPNSIYRNKFTRLTIGPASDLDHDGIADYGIETEKP